LIEEYERIEKSDIKGGIKIYGLRIDEKSFDGSHMMKRQVKSAEDRWRPWNLYPEDQNPDHPPEWEWVSKKGIKSYVYTLKYKTLE
jgi:hypothetical protein